MQHKPWIAAAAALLTGCLLFVLLTDVRVGGSLKAQSSDHCFSYCPTLSCDEASSYTPEVYTLLQPAAIAD
jgi:hypothetical protein